MKHTLFTLLICIVTTLVNAQTDNQIFNISYNTQNIDKIRVHNFDGNVTVTAHNKNTVEIKAIRKIKAYSSQTLAAAREKIKLDSTMIDNELVIFIQAPDKFFQIDEDGNSYYNSHDWNNWDKSKIKAESYEFEFTLDVKVPKGKELYIGTHRKDIAIKGTEGILTAKNHHGNIDVSTTSKELYVKTHHGDIVVENNARSTDNGYFKTHHGDITTGFSGLSASATMDTYHGDVFTDFDYSIAPSLVSSKESGKKGKYKYRGKTSLKIGGGQGSLAYKTHHGNIYIKKI